MRPDHKDLQAAHFNDHRSVVPADRTLRSAGFSLTYILKDQEIAAEVATVMRSRGMKVLDVGCGDGLLLDRVRSTYAASGFGVDVSQASLIRGKTRCLNGFRAARADASKLPFPDEAFDAVFSLDVLEHIEQPEAVVQEIARVLRPSGQVCCYAVSKRNRYTLNWYLGNLMERLGFDHWARAGHHPDLLVDPEVIRSQLASRGFRVISLKLFHAFSTLGFDQLLLSGYWLAGRLSILDDTTQFKQGLSQAILRAVSGMSSLLRPLLKSLDKPWTARGHSNGFLITAEKGKSGIAPAG